MLQGLLIAILIQSLLLAALCFGAPERDGTNRWLGVYFLTIAFQRIFHMALHYTDFFDQWPWLICSYELSVLLGLWAMYRAALGCLGQGWQWVERGLGLFALLYGVFFAWGYASGHWDVTQEYYDHVFSVWAGIGLSGCSVVLALDALWRSRRALASPTAVFSPRSRLLLNAMRWLFHYLFFRSALAVTFAVIRTDALHDRVLLGRWEYAYLVVVNFFLIGLLALVAYFALRNPLIFEQHATTVPTVEQQVALAILPAKEKSLLKHGASADERLELLTRLRACMEQEKPWLDPKITQAKLAERMAMPAYKLSLALQQETGQHFNEYINRYRIAYAKQLLRDPARQRDTMYAIALDSGFASEAPFYAAFKKMTGLSPAAWRASQNNY
jgi:AraC-like DNA-binding protein